MASYKKVKQDHGQNQVHLENRAYRGIIILPSQQSLTEAILVTRLLEEHIPVSQHCYCARDWHRPDGLTRLKGGTDQIVIALPATAEEEMDMRLAVQEGNPDALMFVVKMEGSELPAAVNGQSEPKKTFRLNETSWRSVIPNVVGKFLEGVTDIPSLRPALLATA